MASKSGLSALVTDVPRWQSLLSAVNPVRKEQSMPRVAITRIVSLVSLVFFVVFVPLAACGGENSEGRAPVQPQLPIEMSAAGLSVTLTMATIADSDVQLMFLIEDQAPDDGPSLAQLEPPTPGDIVLDGLAWRSEQGGEMKPIFDEASTAQPLPVVGYQLTLDLRLIAEASKQVSFTFEALPFRAAITGQAGQRIEGPWTFAFTPGDITIASGKRIELGTRVEAEGVTFVVEEITFSSRETLVTYRIESQRQGDIESTGIAAQTADGKFVEVLGIEHAGDQYVAMFPPFQAGDSITIGLQPLLAVIPTAVEIAIPVDGATLSASAPGEPVAINVPVDIASERLVVSEIVSSSTEFTIGVKNVQPNHGGRVLLRVPSAAATLIDNVGNAYTLLKATTNFGKSDPFTMWAEGSSFAFEGAVSPKASLLTLQVSAYGFQLRGPWKVQVEVPSV